MKCITIKQPWATLLVTGATQYVVRSWHTPHRGLLAIHASRLFPRQQIELCCDPVMRNLLRPCGVEYAMQLPTQAVLGTVTVGDCLEVSRDNLPLFDPEDPAVAFGLLQPGSCAWICTAHAAFPEPVPLPGRLGIFTIPDKFLP
jgi:hypothetical protein